jgi:hypothetical protein
MIPEKIRIKIQNLAVCLLATVLAGCGEFFEKKTTELESKEVIQDISRVRENPNTGNPLPDVYIETPRRLYVEDGVKLFYFTKYLPAGDLTFTDKDKNNERRVHGFAGTIRDLGFKVSTNPSTDQLIIHCASDEEADQVLAYLAKTDVPPIQVHIDCMILERFGDVTKDWETTLLVENFMGEDITLGEGKYPNPAFPGAALRESRRSEFGLDFGYWMDQGIPGHQVRAVVDILESRGFLKILMNPTLETVNGQSAQVQIMDRVPIEKTVTERGSITYTVTDYHPVYDMLNVTPHVYSDGSIGLKTKITIGSKSKPEGVVQTSIITERLIDVGENRIDPGKSLVIGGMRKAENRSVIRGIPFFKDLPIVGILFSSKDYEENATEIVFILTPTISSGGTDYGQMSDMIRKKFGSPDNKSDIDQFVNDPLGTRAYSEMVEKKADQAETETIRLQIEAADAKRQALAEQLRREKAMIEAKALRAHAHEAEAQIEKAQAEKKAALAEQEAASKEALAQQAIISQTQEKIAQARAEAAAARAQAGQAQADLKEAEQKVQAFNAEEEAAQEQVRRIQQQIDAIEKQPPSDEPVPAESDPNAKTP